ncbi:MAG: tetratricopeptide repeat protein [Chloroflexota bacterium]
MARARAITTADQAKIRQLIRDSLEMYDRWELEAAIDTLDKAIQLGPDNPDLHLHRARILARYGDYERALRTMGEFIRFENQDTALVERFEALFSNALDDVEKLITSTMTQAGLPLEQVGAAIQMWLEFRIAWGRQPLNMRKPEVWAAALDYTVRKINFREMTQKEIAAAYGISERSVRARFNDLVTTLDIMPCDYRYFRGRENPLDKLVEAATLLEKLETRFQKP